jgi:hypothetical protein
MNRYIAGLLSSLLLLLMASAKLSAQSIFEVPTQCAVALKQDIVSSIKSSNEDLAYMSIVDQYTYDELKHNASAGATIPLTEGLVQGSADYSDYQKQVSNLYSQLGIHYTKETAESLLSETTSTRAYDSFDTCMKTLTAATLGFSAWMESEDAQDLILDCLYSPQPGGHDLKVNNTAINGVVAPKGKTSDTITLVPNGHCPAVVVRRKGGGPLTVTVSGGGFSPSIIHSSYIAPPDNSATLTYTPLIRKEDTLTVDQANFPKNSGLKDGTMDMNNKSGCPGASTAEFCSPDRKHLAFAFDIPVDPPDDGDLIDPGPRDPSRPNTLAVSRDVGTDQGGGFCDEYSRHYLLMGLPGPQYTAQQNETMKRLAGKHELVVTVRCWGPPALWTIYAPEYHMLPGPQIINRIVGFSDGQDFVVTAPKDTPAKLQFAYGKGSVAVVNLGESTADGKIKNTKVFEFNGDKYYVYHYAS